MSNKSYRAGENIAIASNSLDRIRQTVQTHFKLPLNSTLKRFSVDQGRFPQSVIRSRFPHKPINIKYFTLINYLLR